MKRKITSLFLIFFCFCYSLTSAQFKVLSESSIFDEPEDGVSRIIQMKNGNTFYVHVTEKEGVDFRIYDASHKQIVVSSITPSFGKLRTGALQNAFEIANNIAVFISEYQNGAPVLYRLVLDGTTGKLLEDKLIATVKKYTGVGFVNRSLVDAFNVKKAVTGEAYAVEVYDIFEDDKDKRIEIILYDNAHNEKKRTYLVTNDNDDFKFFVYMNMIMLDENRVDVIMYNGKEKYFHYTKKGRMVVATVDSRESNVKITPLDLPEKIKFASCIAQYLPKTKKLYLLIREMNEKDRGNYDNYLVKINTETNKMETKLVIDSDETLNKKYRERFSLREDYLAMYRDFIVHEDETYSIIYEERYSISSPATGFGINKQGTVTFYSGKILVMNYNNKDEVLSGYIVPKSYNEDTYSQYKSPLYIARGSNRYMLINDTERNNDFKKDKFVTITGVSECDAFLYNLSGDEIVPKREYFFGPNTESGHNLGSFRVSSYNPSTGMLVTLKLNKKSPSNKAVSVIWMQVQ